MKTFSFRAQKKRHKKGVVICLLSIVGIIIFTLVGMVISPKLRANVLMPLVSKMASMQSAQNVSLKIPTSSDALLGEQLDLGGWFPHMLVFNDPDGYNRRFGTSIDLTIYYSFGNINAYGSKAYSSIYDIDSPYASAFYGAYVVKGFQRDITDDIRTLSSIPRYDYEHLILSALECPAERLIFDEQVISKERLESYAGLEQWVKYDLSIETTNMAHQSTHFLLHDLQFGEAPNVDGTLAFNPITLLGRVYVHYDALTDTTLMLYVLSPSTALIDATDERLLSNTIVD